MKMQPLVVTGVILAVLGIVALAVSSVTFFTTERVADVGFFTLDISRPHTIVFSPILGGIVLGVGVLLAFVGLRSRAS
jgi:hypothetical protein